MKGINIITAYQLKHWNVDADVGRGAWTPARPIGRTGIRRRIKCAWMVFTGKADVLVWAIL